MHLRSTEIITGVPMSYNEITFENINHFTEEGIEFWYAR